MVAIDGPTSPSSAQVWFSGAASWGGQRPTIAQIESGSTSTRVVFTGPSTSEGSNYLTDDFLQRLRAVETSLGDLRVEVATMAGDVREKPSTAKMWAAMATVGGLAVAAGWTLFSTFGGHIIAAAVKQAGAL